MANKYDWVPVVNRARKAKSLSLDELKILCLARWEDELVKLNTSGSIIPSAEYYKGYREALRDLLFDLRIKYPKLKYLTRYKKSKGTKLKHAN